AAREHRPPGQYDLLVGRYLFYRQNSMQGHVPIGVAGDDVMLGEGWGPRETWDGASARRVDGRARLFAPLDVAEDLVVTLRAAGPATGSVRLVVNGTTAATLDAGGPGADHAVRV